MFILLYASSVLSLSITIFINGLIFLNVLLIVTSEILNSFIIFFLLIWRFKIFDANNILAAATDVG